MGAQGWEMVEGVTWRRRAALRPLALLLSHGTGLVPGPACRQAQEPRLALLVAWRERCRNAITPTETSQSAWSGVGERGGAPTKAAATCTV